MDKKYISIQYDYLSNLTYLNDDLRSSINQKNIMSFDLINSSNPNECFSLNKKLERKKQILKITDEILIYYSVFVIITGTFFNAINFFCFYRMKKRNSQNIYLGALSLSEILNLHINITLPLVVKTQTDSLNFIFSSSNRLTNKYFCIINGYAVEVALLLPNWILVILSLERCLCLMFPLRKNSFSTRKKAKLTLSILVVVILLWCCFKFYTAGVEVYDTFRMDFTDEYCPDWPITAPAMVNVNFKSFSLLIKIINGF
jgi:hypothetical protein